MRQRFDNVELCQWEESLMWTYVYLNIKAAYPILQNVVKTTDSFHQV